MEPLAATQHIVSNVEGQVDGDRAAARCYLRSTHVRTTPDGGDFAVAGAPAHDLIRTPDGWRIVRRSARGSGRLVARTTRPPLCAGTEPSSSSTSRIGDHQ